MKLDKKFTIVHSENIFFSSLPKKINKKNTWNKSLLQILQHCSQKTFMTLIRIFYVHFEIKSYTFRERLLNRMGMGNQMKANVATKSIFSSPIWRSLRESYSFFGEGVRKRRIRN